MSTFKYTFFFKIRYETKYGQNLYICGNIKAFGAWDINKSYMLEWHDDHYWMGKLTLNHNRNEHIEYKYIVCNTDKGYIKSLDRWEQGPNRLLDLTKTNSLNLVIDDHWEFRTVILRLRNELNEPSHSIYIIGDTEELGLMKTPKKTEFIVKKDPLTKILERYWEYRFLISSMKSSIKYLYAIYDEKDKKYLWERFIERRINFDENSSNFQQDYKNNVNLSDCLYFKLKLNKYKKIDCNLQMSFYHYKVNENLIVGAFPYNLEEVDYLSREGIKAILNLNNFEEFTYNMINWDIITKYYPEKDMEVVDFQFLEKDFDEYMNKIRYAAFVLHNLISASKKVYVHSTIGKYKVTELIVTYLCIYKSFSWEAALKFIKLKKPSIEKNKLFQVKNTKKLTLTGFNGKRDLRFRVKNGDL